MSDDESFLRAIEGSPADDTLRLAYADWLEDRGDPRSAFLRLECDLAGASRADQRGRLAEFLKLRGAAPRAWLMRLEQPRALRVNPTPFPARWIPTDRRVGLPARPDVIYSSLPPLPVEKLRGDFSWLKAVPQPYEEFAEDPPGRESRRLEQLQRYLDRGEAGIVVPDEVLALIADADLLRRFPATTGSIVSWPLAMIPCPRSHGDWLLRFCENRRWFTCDWYVYLTPSGSHSVVVSTYSSDQLVALSRESENGTDTGCDPTTLDIWFCAPTFEAFFYRYWLESQIERALFVDVPLEGELAAYHEFCRNRGVE